MPPIRSKGRALIAPEFLWLAGIALPVAGIGLASFMGPPLPTTIDDFFQPGTQPLGLMTPIQASDQCSSCHGDFDAEHEPFRPWAASMMGQAARDPLFLAALTVANQDASFAGDMCIRCHSPGGWLEGRSTPTDGSGLMGTDLEGVNCNFCHRMVDPIHDPGVDPDVDSLILGQLTDVPTTPHTGQFVVDPKDNRRGPYDLGEFPYHNWLEAPFQSSSNMCATCHDVSNPVMEKQPDGTYMPGTMGAPAASHNPYDQFPIERTYSEWSQSAFADAPIDLAGRFAPNLSAVSSCQDCHMPPAEAQGCFFGDVRPQLSTHHLRGGNTWMLDAIRNLYPDSETYLSADSVALAKQKSVELLQEASDMTLTQVDDDLVVRITNYSAHKLPTGYPEGRRMWINVQFFDETDALIAEHGAYNATTAELTTADTKVYEAKLGISAALAPTIGKPAGESFHFVLNNEWLKDNRIPPMGFNNADFDAVQAAPVAYTYADGQHWDDTTYTIPAGAVRADVKLNYQTASKEYIEFLRDENTTNMTGQIMYDQWVLAGKGPPVVMDDVSISFEEPCLADVNGDGAVTPTDFSAWVGAFNNNLPGCDQNGDGKCTPTDFSAWIGNFNAGCP
ncbi:MAG: GC-type dockerin domain-anchored protein [Phycisphaerales bacterium JB061]